MGRSDRYSDGKVTLLPDQGNITIQVKDPSARVVSGDTVTWQTGREARYRAGTAVPGVIVTFTMENFYDRTSGKRCPGATCRWATLDRTIQVSGLNPDSNPPGGVKIKNAVDESPIYDANSGNSYTSTRSFPYFGRYIDRIIYLYYLEFSTLGTHVVDYTAGVTRRSDSALQEDTGTYTFHVGPVAELGVRAVWDAPGVFTVTALNHGPDDAPAARVTVTPPSGLRFARGEASRGSFDTATGVWNIGELETSDYRRAAGLPEGATLTVFTEPAGNTVTPNQVITARVENTEDYCVRIKTGDIDLECRGDLPSGYTEHSAVYYDYRPDNNRVTLPAEWTAVPVADTRLTGIAITSQGGYRAGDDIEVTATFNKSVTVAGQPRLRLRVGEITQEAALHSNSGSTVVFRYRVQEGDSDSVDGVSIPPSPFILPRGAGIAVPGGGRVSLFFAGLSDQSAHKVYPATGNRVAGSNALVWSAEADLYTGVEGARYRLFERIRHYYRYNDLTRRWEIEFRIADASLDAPDQNLIQWLYLRTGGYYLARPHIYGATPVEMKPYLGGWAGSWEHQQQLCTGFKAEFSLGKTREQRLEELKDVEIHRFSYKPYGDGEYEVSQRENVENSLRTARGIASKATCPDPPSGMVTIQGQASNRGPLGAALSDPNGVNRDSVTWQWKRSPEGTTQQNVGYTGFSDITGATGSSYVPGEDDEGRWLRVKATYTDGQRATRSAWGQSEGPVTGTAQQQQEQPETGRTVAADWPLIPAGLGVGDSFRLLFVTSATTSAEAADIADYNDFVRASANGNDSLKLFKDEFTALVSTSAMDAKHNTGTTGEGVPILWLGGEKVADDYADFYDGDWDSVSGKTEGGDDYIGLVWTGGNKAGEKSGQRYAGAVEVRVGDLSDATMPLSSPAARASGESYPLYALSPVITVAEPESVEDETQGGQQQQQQETAAVTGLGMHSSGPYGAGDAVSVAVTFSRDVTVSGAPELSVELGGTRRAATYDAARSGPSALVFSYTVSEDDMDADGVSVYPGSIVLPQGASITDSGGNDAELAQPGLAPQPGHTVDASQEEEPARQQQQEANNDPQFALTADTRGVDENAATGSNVGSPVTATDADGDALTYTLSGSNAFAINAGSGQITVQAALDYETQNSYSLTVSVSDGKDASGVDDDGVDDTIAVTVNVGNVDEAGTVTLNPQTPQAGSALAASLSDPDGGVSGESWVWQVSADGTSWTDIDGASGATYTPTAGDVGSYLRATASYADGHGSGKSAAATTGVVEAAPAPPPAPQPPAITAGPVITSSPSAGDTYDEGGTIVVAVTFSEAVTVAGEPRVRLKIGERNRWARYARSEANGTKLVFAYTVKGSDRDEDGVSIEADQLWLNGGSITDADGNAAGLEHPALAAQSGHKVDGSLDEQPAQQQQQAAPIVAADSPLVPTGLRPGDSFRLLFVTSTTTAATAADIAHYNAFVQARAAANANLAGFSGQFTALISTASVDARDNTETTGSGVPIYWLGGEKVADDHADLYDNDWDSVSGKTESGSAYTGLVWTGGNKTGGKSGQRYAGADEVRLGDLSNATLPLSSPMAKAATESYPLYALSPVITVAQPE